MKKRMTILVDEDIFLRLNTEVRHGFRGPLIAGVLKMTLDAIQTDGEMMLGALLTGQYKLVPAYTEVA